MQYSVAILCFKMAKKLSHANKNLLRIFLQLNSTKAEPYKDLLYYLGATKNVHGGPKVLEKVLLLAQQVLLNQEV